MEFSEDNRIEPSRHRIPDFYEDALREFLATRLELEA